MLMLLISRKNAGLLGIGIVILALIFQSFSIWEPITGDASLFSALQREMVGEADFDAIDLKAGRGIWHPMLYQNILYFVGKTIGTDLFYIRLLGVLTFLLTCLLIFLIVSHLYKNNQNEMHLAAVLSVALYALNPFGLVFSMHLDIDNTVLTIVILLNVLYFLKINGRVNLANTICASFLFAFALWCKLTTPFLLLPAFFFYFFMTKKYKVAFSFTATVFLIGSLVFFVTWIYFCYLFGFPWIIVFQRIINVFGAKISASLGMDINSFLRLLLSVIYWISPYFVIMLVMSVLHILASSKEDKDMLFVTFLGYLIFGTYFFIGGLPFSVPKYHYPSLPLLAIAVAHVCSRILNNTQYKIQNMHFFTFLFSLCVLTIYFLLIGDPLYHLNFGLKKFILENNLPKTIHNYYLKVIIKDIALYVLILLPLLIIFFSSSKKRIFVTACYLIWLTFGYYMAMDIIQAKANYNVIYCYGGEGSKELVSQLKNKSRVFLLEGAIYLPFNKKEITFYMPSHLNINDRNEVMRYIKNIDPDYFIYGLSINTIEQFDNIFNNAKFRKFMSERYNLFKTGTYFYWEKVGLR